SQPPPHPRSTLFPYTTLFRSGSAPKLPRLAVACRGARATAGLKRRAPAGAGEPSAPCYPSPAPEVSVTHGPPAGRYRAHPPARRSEEHTSELQSRENLVCRLL